MFMNRVGRMPFLILLAGALLLPAGIRYAQERRTTKTPPRDKKQDHQQEKEKR